MKILIVEDEEKITRALKKGLEEQNYSVEVAYDGLMGKKLILSGEFDLIILDVILPGKNGLDICREIREMGNTVPILMLTALGTTEDKVTGLDVGADDYLIKPFDFNELLARIRALLRRRPLIAEDTVLRAGDLTLNTASKRVKRGEEEIKLTPREFRLLEFLLRNKEKVIDRSLIAENVWGVDFDTGTNVVDVYINYLRNKIDKDFKVKLLHTVVGMGYLITENNED